MIFRRLVNLWKLSAYRVEQEQKLVKDVQGKIKPQLAIITKPESTNVFIENVEKNQREQSE